MTLVLVLLLIVILLGGIPLATSGNWNGPYGIVGVILIVLVVLMLVGRI